MTGFLMGIDTDEMGQVYQQSLFSKGFRWGSGGAVAKPYPTAGQWIVAYPRTGILTYSSNADGPEEWQRGRGDYQRVNNPLEVPDARPAGTLAEAEAPAPPAGPAHRIRYYAWRVGTHTAPVSSMTSTLAVARNTARRMARERPGIAVHIMQVIGEIAGE